MQRKPWFAAKRYGWGWQPATWQGWLCLAAHLAVVVACALVMARFPDAGVPFLLAFGTAILSTLALVAVAYRTGEPARWRWSSKR